MKSAFSTLENRIAPVFDASNQIRLVEVESGKIVRSENDTLPNDLPVQKALRLVELNLDLLVCGAISRAMHDLIISYGIRVIPFIAGPIDEIVQACISGRSDLTCFSMPGCMGSGRRRSMGGVGNFQKANLFQKEGFMNVRAPGGRGMGSNQGGGGPRRAQSKAGGRMAGVIGDCVCPKCGHKQQHLRGTPCFENRCTRCGAPMVRG